MRQQLVAILACCGLLFVFLQDATAEPASLVEIASMLRLQDQAWRDIKAHYTCKQLAVASNGTRELKREHRMTWSMTDLGWERMTRTTSRKGSFDWVEEASFDGQYYMAGDSQGLGSGAIGHQIHPFLQISESPKYFGLYVTGMDIGMPMSVAEFLASRGSDIKVIESSSERWMVEGPDPYGEHHFIKLTLDSRFGFRPSRIELRDELGVYTIFEIGNYDCFQGERGRFWFPKSGKWIGFDPEARVCDSEMEYELQDLSVDQHPNESHFRLHFPKGAALLNRDTGEGAYLTADSIPGDVPTFPTKLETLEDHDLRVTRSERSGLIAPARSNRGWLYVINVVVLAATILVMVYKRVRHPSQ